MASVLCIDIAYDDLKLVFIIPSSRKPSDGQDRPFSKIKIYQMFQLIVILICSVYCDNSRAKSMCPYLSISIIFLHMFIGTQMALPHKMTCTDSVPCYSTVILALQHKRNV